MALIFVGGIHGVGKGVFCRALAPLLGASTLSAGEVLKSAGLQPSGKPVDDVDGNQAFLIGEVKKALLVTPRLLLDGHFALLRPDGRMSTIPVAVFAALGPERLVVLTAPIEEIQERIQRRDGTRLPLQILEGFQALEQSHARVVAEFLDLPLITLAEGTSIEEAKALLLDGNRQGDVQ